jgi:crotonobetainyl-CoA:carnitine CoA-transferase CaiB-like acyl-CoA transferase
VQQRPRLLAASRAAGARSAAELAAIFERAGLPFAPIRKPEDLYDDPHLQATGGLAEVVLPDGDRAGQTVKTTLLPLHPGRRSAGRASAAAAPSGAHTDRAAARHRLRRRGEHAPAPGRPRWPDPCTTQPVKPKETQP